MILHQVQLLFLFELNFVMIACLQLISVISLLSSETPNTDSPANVDAAKEVRTDLVGV